MLRSFGVVGALAAAALALVIGIIAFNAHSNDSKNRPFAGGPQSGVADHPVAVSMQDPRDPNQYRYTNALPADNGGQGGISAQRGGSGPGGAVTTSFGGASAQAPQATPNRSCGVVSGLLATLGGLLGGSGTC